MILSTSESVTYALLFCVSPLIQKIERIAFHDFDRFHCQRRLLDLAGEEYVFVIEDSGDGLSISQPQLFDSEYYSLQ